MSWSKKFQLYNNKSSKNQAELFGMVNDFQKFSINDGPGIRTIVFLKGCPLQCYWCSNPENVSSLPEIMYISHNCIGCGKCDEVCQQKSYHHDEGIITFNREKCILPECDGICQHVCYANAINISGRHLTVGEVMEEVLRDREFYERTGGGVTFSGGEPFAQPHFLLELARAAKSLHLHTAIETCGFARWPVMDPILKYLDLVFYDLKHMNSETHLKGTGVNNELILDNLKRIDATGTPVRVRLPLIPGFNDSERNIRETSSFISGLSNLEALDILPYHRMGEPKWDQLDRAYKLNGVTPHDKEKVSELADIARTYGIDVTIGG
jgi:pyruvate formate lyase activating enzyme